MNTAKSLRAQRRVLAQWRGIDLSALEKNKSAARSSSEILPKILADLRIDKRRHEAEIVKVWNSLVDPTVAAHAQPAGIAKGTLFVNVDNSVWLEEIVRFRRKEILNQLQHAFGREMIGKIAFRIG